MRSIPGKLENRAPAVLELEAAMDKALASAFRPRPPPPRLFSHRKRAAPRKTFGALVRWDCLLVLGKLKRQRVGGSIGRFVAMDNLAAQSVRHEPRSRPPPLHTGPGDGARLPDADPNDTAATILALGPQTRLDYYREAGGLAFRRFDDSNGENIPEEDWPRWNDDFARAPRLP
jgi:hypothetical protein